MQTTLARIFFFVSLLIVVGFVITVVNQTAQIVNLAALIDPRLGLGLLFTLILIYAICIVVPIVLFVSLPKPLRPPRDETAPEFPQHLIALQQRLNQNAILKKQGLRVTNRQEVDAALQLLDQRAQTLITNTAGVVFTSTAISQNGNLDGLLVLVTQTRLIWQVAHVYYQRPTLREMLDLYANVGATAFVAGSIADIDLSEQVQPIVSGVLGSAAGAIPGLNIAATLLANSILQGSANALLTLRVGVITRRYCSALVLADRRALRKSATAEAVVLLGNIVVEGTKGITKAFVEAATRQVSATKASTTQTIKDLGTAVKDAMLGASKTSSA
ncbi:MAG: YcjF family protein [Anaerolineales bacterium]|nr:YcjF family protein [Anaerolineales bacterium]